MLEIGRSIYIFQRKPEENDPVPKNVSSYSLWVRHSLFCRLIRKGEKVALGKNINLSKLSN